MSETTIVELPEVDPGRRAAAILSVATADGRAAWLRKGAAATVGSAPDDGHAAKAFQMILEVGYLVASADGFADDERTSLSQLLESITGAAVDVETLTLHFRDLDEAVAVFGRHERLARAAADVEGTDEAEEAISVAALIALGDGRLSAPELDVLVELGAHLSIPATRVRGLVEDVASRVEAQLR